MRVEDLKQQLLTRFDYSALSIFRAIDQFGHGKITKDNLRVWLWNFEESRGLTEKDVKAWIAKWDRDNDGALGFYDLVKALQTMTPYKRQKIDIAQPVFSKSESEKTELQTVDVHKPKAVKQNLRNRSNLSKQTTQADTLKTMTIDHQDGTDGETHFEGVILNYPYSFDQDHNSEVVF